MNLTRKRLFLLCLIPIVLVLIIAAGIYTIANDSGVGKPISTTTLAFSEIEPYLSSDNKPVVDKDGNYTLTNEQFKEYTSAKTKERYDQIEDKSLYIENLKSELAKQDVKNGTYRQWVIDSAGGEIQIANLNIKFFKDFHNEPLIITYQLKDLKIEDKYSITDLKDKVFEITAQTLYGQEITQFKENSVSFGLANPDTELNTYYFDDEVNSWVSMDTSHDSTKTITNTNHFTNFIFSTTPPAASFYESCSLTVDDSDSSPCFGSSGIWQNSSTGYKGTSKYTPFTLRGTANFHTEFDKLPQEKISVSVSIPDLDGMKLVDIQSYVINTGSGVIQAFVDQESDRGKIVDLGEYTFKTDPSISTYGLSSDDAKSYSVVDAVSFGDTGDGGIGGGGQTDFAAPKIEDVKAIGINGELKIQAKIYDNETSVTRAYVVINGQIYEMTKGTGDIWAAQVPFDSTAKLGDYGIVAFDEAGNQGYWSLSRGYFVGGNLNDLGISPWDFYQQKNGNKLELHASCPGTNFANQYCADPINTKNGNLYEEYSLIEIPGRPAINFGLKYNSLGGAEGIFGYQWTHDYNYHLIAFDNELFKATYIQYPDGRVVEFSGSELTPAPGNFEQLKKDGNKYILTYKDLRKVEFDSKGDVTKIEDANGNALNFEYGQQYDNINLSQLQSIKADGGRELNLEYNAIGLVSKITSAENLSITFDYNDSHDLIAITDANSQKMSYEYNQDHQILKKITPKGHTAYVNEYDAQGRVISQIAGEKFKQSLKFETDKTIVTDNNNTQATYFYNEDGLMHQLKDEKGAIMSYEFNSQKQITKQTDPELNITEFKYDENGNQIEIVDAEGNIITREFGMKFNKPTKEINKISDHVTTWKYDDNGNLEEVKNAIGDTQTFKYNAKGQLVSSFDFRNNPIFFEYTSEGDIKKFHDAEGNITEFKYDGVGRMTHAIDPKGISKKYKYDNNSNIVEINGALGYKESFKYDQNNHLIESVDAKDYMTEYQYDKSENLTAEIDPLKNKMTYNYGSMNERVSQIDKLGRITEYKYDPTYQLNQILEAKDTLNQRTTKVNYDKARIQNQIIDGNGNSITLEIDNLYRIQKESFGSEELKAENTYEYNATGAVIKETDANSNSTIYELDSLDRIKKKIDSEGNETKFYYDENNNITKVKNPRGFETEYEYDKLNRIKKSKNAQDGETRFEYDANGNLTKQISPNKVTIEYVYDELNRMVEKREDRESENLVTKYAYDLNNNIQSVTNPKGYATTFDYDELNRNTKVTDVKGKETVIAYDAEGNILSIKDRNAAITANKYDELNRLIEVINAESGLTNYKYDKLENLTEVKNPNGDTTKFKYDALYRLTEKVDALENITAFDYDLAGNLLKETDANKHATSYAYDKIYRLLEIQNPELETKKYAYDENGNVKSFTDPKKNTYSFTYDELDRLTESYNPLLTNKKYEYDQVGNLLALIDENGHTDKYVYDNLNRLTHQIDAEGFETKFKYDRNSNLTEVIDANSNPTNYNYDELDRLVEEINAESETTKYEYDNEANIIGEIAPDSVVKGYGYDKIYRLTQVIEDKNGLNAQTEYKYDPNGNLTKITDPNGHATDFEYDELNRQIREVNAIGHTWSYKYDAVGNKLTRTDANGQQTGYSYYPDNQLANISYQSSVISFQYDANNNRSLMTDSLGSSEWEYDQLNRPISVNDSLDRSLTYEYDNVGNTTKVKYPDSSEVKYGYLKNDWLKDTNIASLGGSNSSINYSRDNVGNVLNITNSNNTSSAYSYNKVYRPTNIKNYEVSGKVNSEFIYQYNNVGLRTNVTENYAWRTPSQINSDYTYDNLRRLVSSSAKGEKANRGVINNEYSYDLAGNRLAWKSNDAEATPKPFDKFDLKYEYNAANELMRIYQKATKPKDPKVSNETKVIPGQETTETITKQVPIPQVSIGFIDNVKQFVNHMEAQKGKQITEAEYNNIMSKLNKLLSDSETGLITQVEATKQLDEIKKSINELANKGQATSLLEQLKHVELAVNTLPGELQYETVTEEVTVTGESTTVESVNVMKPDPIKEILFTYDNNGNRIKKEIKDPKGNPQSEVSTYTYDPENRLSEFVGPKSNESVSMQYDGLGRRLIKQNANEKIEYLFDNLDPIAEFNTKNSQYSNFYRGAENRIVMSQDFPKGSGGQQSWYHYDALRSVVGLTKQDGQSNHNYNYEDYGLITPTEGNFTEPHNQFTYTGQLWDNEMKVYEFYSRAYDPEVGVWLQQDHYRGSVEDPQSLHRYGYVKNDPINNVDYYGYLDITPSFVDKGFDDIEDEINKGFSEIASVYEILGDTILLDQQDYYQYSNIQTYAQEQQEKTAKYYDNKIGTTLVGTCVSVVNEPADWVMTGYQCANGDCKWYYGLALLPLIPGTITRKADDAVDASKGLKKILNTTNDIPISTVDNVSDNIYLSDKILKQMRTRGWTEEIITNTIEKTVHTSSALNKANGNPATAYFNQDGSYVVVDNITKQVIQISDKLDPLWIPDNTIINPYLP